MSRSFHDDNFGAWEIDGPEDVEFYKQVQRESRQKTCQGCGRTVRLRPDYGYCNSCADDIENGRDF